VTTIFIFIITAIEGTTFLGIADSFNTLPVVPDLVYFIFNDNNPFSIAYYLRDPSVIMIPILKSMGDKTPKSNRVFIKTPRDLNKYVRLVLWSCMVPKHHHKSFKEFSNSLEILWKRSGKKFAGMYMKACIGLVVSFCNHKPTTSPIGTIQVRTRKGLPVVIPIALRKCIKVGDTRMISSILTVLNIYRCIK